MGATVAAGSRPGPAATGRLAPGPRGDRAMAACPPRARVFAAGDGGTDGGGAGAIRRAPRPPLWRCQKWTAPGASQPRAPRANPTIPSNTPPPASNGTPTTTDEDATTIATWKAAAEYSYR